MVKISTATSQICSKGNFSYNTQLHLKSFPPKAFSTYSSTNVPPPVSFSHSTSHNSSKFSLQLKIFIFTLYTAIQFHMIVNIIYIIFFKAEISFFSSVFPLFSLSMLCIGFLLWKKLPQTQLLFPSFLGSRVWAWLSWIICSESLRLKLRCLLRLPHLDILNLIISAKSLCYIR